MAIIFADDRSTEFHDKANALRGAAEKFLAPINVAIANRSVTSVRTAVRTLRVPLIRECGSALPINVHKLEAVFDLAKSILVHQAIADVSNTDILTTPVAAGWPTAGVTEADITQKISQTLSELLPNDVLSMAQERFANLQQVADYGAQTVTSLRVDPVRPRAARELQLQLLA